MAFGFKFKTIQTSKEYTIEDFYGAIKDKSFTAGVPSLTKHGLVTIITYPALDSQNQVQILLSGIGKESKKFQVQKAEEAGVKNMAANMVLDTITKGLFGWGSVAGKSVKRCEELVDITYRELGELKL